MLEPASRHLFTDGLRPPTGFTLDVAVGTTYTLDLSTLLLPPLAIAAHDRQRDEDAVHDDKVDIALLEAVRRFMGRITVFCHAGAIHVPSQYRRVLAFAEDSVVQVLPEKPGHTFHPKVWFLRFVDDTRNHRHRLLVLSRNLTKDTSWDTIVQLEESQRGRIAGAPAADFLTALPRLAEPLRPMDPERIAQIGELAGTIGGTSFSVPHPYTTGELWPLGTDRRDRWPVHPRDVQALLAISPFVDAARVGRLSSATTPVVVSRAESFTAIGREPFAGMDTRILDPNAHHPVDAPPHPLPWEITSGLHAKVLAWDLWQRTYLFTGSANLTTAAFGGNVEFNVRLAGPRSRCSVRTIFPEEPPKDEVSLPLLMVPYEIPNDEPQPDLSRGAEMAVANYLAALALAGPRLTVTTDADGETFGIDLTFARDLPQPPGTTAVHLLSRPSGSDARPIEDGVSWAGLTLSELTAFLQVRVTVPVEGHEPLTLSSVLTAELLGAPDDRQARVLRDLVRDEDDVLRYLAYLLDESGADTFGLGLLDGEEDLAGPQHSARGTFDDLALVETLVRAAARGDTSLDHVNRFIGDLTDEEGNSPALSEAFLSVWSAVWDAVSSTPETEGL